MRTVNLVAVLAALLSMTALSALAQDHSAPSHAMAPSRGGTTGGLHVGAANSNTSNPGRHDAARAGHSGYPKYRGFGYGYPYGAPVELQYDSEYDQLEGRGTFDRPQDSEPPDNRVGPTIFEHNGQAATANATSRSSASVSAQPAYNHEPASSESSGSASTIVLVFRDGHQQDVSNYAIAGSHLIVVGEKTQKILLSDLDLSATSKANADRGVDFKMPKPS